MKKCFIIFILINLTFSVFASNFNIGTLLVLDSKQNVSLLKNDKASAIVENVDTFQFDDVDVNNFNYITNLCNSYLTDISLNDDFKKKYLEREVEKDLKTLTNKLSSYYDSYSSQPTNASLNNINKTTEAISNLTIDNDETILESGVTFKFNGLTNGALIGLLVENEDKTIINNLLNSYSLNGFLVVSFPSINNIKRVKIEYLDNEKRDIIYDRILKTQFCRDNTLDILKSLLSYFNGDYSFLTLNNKTPSARIRVVNNISKENLEGTDEKNYSNVYLRDSDLSTLDINKDYIVIKKEFIIFNIKLFYSYIQKVEITENDNVLDLKLEEAIVESVNLLSNVGSVNFQLNSTYLKTASSLNLTNQSIPFFVDVKKEGFSPLTVQNLSDTENIELSLKPTWLGDSKVSDKAQDDFYSSLLTFILLNFTTITVNNINSAFGNSDLVPILDVLSTSVVSLSSINVIYKLISYLKLTTM